MKQSKKQNKKCCFWECQHHSFGKTGLCCGWHNWSSQQTM